MIYEILLEGKENAQTSRAICSLLNINSRDLTIAIERERRAGRPICASSGEIPGYYIAANRAEMQQYCDRLKHRAGEIFKTRAACLQTLEGLPE